MILIALTSGIQMTEHPLDSFISVSYSWNFFMRGVIFVVVLIERESENISQRWEKSTRM